MSAATYTGVALIVFLLTGAIQFAGWTRIGASHMKDEPNAKRAALRRWIVFALAYQVAVLAGIGVYVFITVRTHPPAGWAAPAIGAVFGTALPLQLVVYSISRANR